MKIYTKVRIDMLTGETIEEESFEYDGPMALCYEGGGDHDVDSQGPDAPDGGYGGGGGGEGGFDPDVSLNMPDPGKTVKEAQDEVDAIERGIGWGGVKDILTGVVDFFAGGLLSKPEALGDIKTGIDALRSLSVKVPEEKLKDVFTPEELESLNLVSNMDPKEIATKLNESDQGGEHNFIVNADGVIVDENAASETETSEESTSFADTVNSFDVGDTPTTSMTIDPQTSALESTTGVLLQKFYDNPDADPAKLTSDFFDDVDKAKVLISEGGETYRGEVAKIAEKWDIGHGELWNLAGGYREAHTETIDEIGETKGPYLSVGGVVRRDPDTGEPIRMRQDRFRRNDAALADQRLAGGLQGVKGQGDLLNQWATGALDTTGKIYDSTTNDAKDTAALSGTKLSTLMEGLPELYAGILDNTTKVGVANLKESGANQRAGLDADTQMRLAKLRALTDVTTTDSLIKGRADIAEENKPEEPSFWEKVLGALS